MGAELPEDIEALKAEVIAAQTRAIALEAELAVANARNSEDAATILRLKFQIARLNRESKGPSSERAKRLTDQLELELEDAVSAA